MQAAVTGTITRSRPSPLSWTVWPRIVPPPPSIAACQQLGWQFDEAAGVLRVVSKPQVQAEHEGAGNLQSLAHIMSHIEH